VNSLLEAIDNRRVEIDAVWEERTTILLARLDEIIEAWTGCVDAQCAIHEDNVLEETKRCEEESMTQSNLLDYFKEMQLERFNTWETEETEALEEFIAECEEAWEWIL
jgi:hypothetical protein